MTAIKKSPSQIKEEVREGYTRRIEGKSEGCCTSSCCGGESGKHARSIGYDDQTLAALPDHAVENSFGCGNPLAFSEVKEGDTVVDIGSGAGIDCFVAAGRVGESGRVIGIDMTDAMLEKATANAQAGGFSQVEFRKGEAENMPVDRDSVDWVISNCVINLSPDKPAVFSEIGRVLKSGGRFSISDVVAGNDLPEEIANNLPAWTGCLAGAIREEEYLAGLAAAGLTDIRVTERLYYSREELNHMAGEMGIDPDLTARHIDELADRIWSAKIVGRKV
ncbi:MAG TPA: arsenite methyltransferase [Calditrichia bacterium]|nr:arsenite methyltransferase [Calditrichota bacterium]HQU71225.1 arsenite methyltransferase [Calditrichia bacterium]HQV33042.1 arsenite methyltransferase [Calditrichia bacterium]